MMVAPPTDVRSSGATQLDSDAVALHDALNELVRVYQFRDRDTICCYDVSVTQCYAIEALLRRGPSGLNDLAAELYLDKSTTSRVVATLERKGYVTRARHPEDGRAVVLSVTGPGRRLHDRIRKDLVEEERSSWPTSSPRCARPLPCCCSGWRAPRRAVPARAGGGCLLLDDKCE